MKSIMHIKMILWIDSSWSRWTFNYTVCTKTEKETRSVKKKKKHVLLARQYPTCTIHLHSHNDHTIKMTLGSVHKRPLSPRHSFLVFYFKQNISTRACLDSHGTISISCVNEAVWTWHNWSPSRRCQSWPKPWDVYRTVWHKRAVMCNSLPLLLPAISLRSYRTIWQATIKKRREKHCVQQALTEIFFLFLWSIWSPEGAGRVLRMFISDSCSLRVKNMLMIG